MGIQIIHLLFLIRSSMMRISISRTFVKPLSFVIKSSAPLSSCFGQALHKEICLDYLYYTRNNDE